METGGILYKITNKKKKQCHLIILYKISKLIFYFRFGCTIAQKNKGERYVLQTLDDINISYGAQLPQHFAARHSFHLKRKNKAETQEFEKRRIQQNCDKVQLRYRREKNEGETYSSNMSLFEKSPIYKNCVSECKEYTSYETEDVSIVFFLS